MRPDRPSDPERTPISLSRGPIQVSQEGPNGAPVILMVHGYPGSGRDFRWLAPALNRWFRVIRLDMPGMGGTPVHTGKGTRLESRVDVVQELIETMDLRDFCVLGHSMGGGIVSAVAGRCADRIRALVLLSSIGLRPHRLFRQTYPGATQRALDIPVIGSLAWPLVRWGYRRAGFSRSITDSELRYALLCAATLDFTEVSRSHRSHQIPTMSAWAEDDPMIESNILQELDAVLPFGPRLSFQTGGHNIQKTRAGEIAEELISWLKDSCDFQIDP